VDALYVALSGNLDLYDKPEELLPFVITARDAIYERLQRPSKVRYAWVITSEPEGAKLRQLESRLKAPVIKLWAEKEECLRRISVDPSRPKDFDWAGLLDSWFSRYTP
jgi:hypothetical protein